MSPGLLLLLHMTVMMAAAAAAGPSCSHRCQGAAGGRCLEAAYVCDGHEDCANGDDEWNCSGRCAASARDCGDGRCVPAAYWCDGHRDCGNGTEEAADEATGANCTLQHALVDFLGPNRKQSMSVDSWFWPFKGNISCSSSKTANIFCSSPTTANISCSSSTTANMSCSSPMTVQVPCSWGLLPSKRDAAVECDGHVDAENACDERHCSNCTAGAFFCAVVVECDQNHQNRGRCWPAARRCDGVRDCVDGQDEAGCTSTTPSTTIATTSRSSGNDLEAGSGKSARSGSGGPSDQDALPAGLPVYAWLIIFALTGAALGILSTALWMTCRHYSSAVRWPSASASLAANRASSFVFMGRSAEEARGGASRPGRPGRPGLALEEHVYDEPQLLSDHRESASYAEVYAAFAADLAASMSSSMSSSMRTSSRAASEGRVVYAPQLRRPRDIL